VLLHVNGPAGCYYSRRGAYTYGRLLIGMLVTIAYTICLMAVKPYRRSDHDVLAIVLQVTLLLLFFGAQAADV